MIQKKKCSKCKKEKPFNQFECSNNGYLSRKCKICKKAQYQYRRPIYVNIKIKLKIPEYKSIRQVAMNSGYSVGKYILLLHENKNK